MDETMNGIVDEALKLWSKHKEVENRARSVWTYCRVKPTDYGEYMVNIAPPDNRMYPLLAGIVKDEWLAMAICDLPELLGTMLELAGEVMALRKKIAKLEEVA